MGTSLVISVGTSDLCSSLRTLSNSVRVARKKLNSYNSSCPKRLQILDLISKAHLRARTEIHFPFRDRIYKFGNVRPRDRGRFLALGNCKASTKVHSLEGPSSHNVSPEVLVWDSLADTVIFESKSVISRALGFHSPFEDKDSCRSFCELRTQMKSVSAARRKLNNFKNSSQKPLQTPDLLGIDIGGSHNQK